MNSRSVLTTRSLFALASIALVATACSSGTADDGTCHPTDSTCNHASADGGSTSDGSASQGNDSGASSGDSGASTGNDSGTSTGGDAGHESGTGHGDGGGPHDGGADAGGGFGVACTQNGDCPGAYPVCFTFNNGSGKHCTKTCQSAADCPNPPNFGCNGMGVCKVQ